MTRRPRTTQPRCLIDLTRLTAGFGAVRVAPGVTNAPLTQRAAPSDPSTRGAILHGGARRPDGGAGGLACMARRLRSLGLAAFSLLGATAWAAQACDKPSPQPLGGADTPPVQTALAPGVGGTGAPAPTRLARSIAAPGGQGGTGATRSPGGLGGTGIEGDGLGGTGIVGMISGFASICVNGLEVHYAAQTPITLGGQRVPEHQLAVGQWVAVQAQPSAAGWQAQRVSVLLAATGTLQAVAPDHLRLLGQTVALEPGLEGTRWRVGQRVQISGVRDASGLLHASHVAPAAADAPDLWSGQLSARTAAHWQVDGLRVQPATGPAAGPAPALGQEVQVQGRWDGTQLQALRTQAEPTRQALGAVQAVIIAGYVRAGQAGPSVGAQALMHNAALTQAQTTGARVQVQAQRDALGRLQVQQVQQVQQVRSAPAPGRGMAPEAAAPATPAQPVAADPKRMAPMLPAPAPQAEARPYAPTLADPRDDQPAGQTSSTETHAAPALRSAPPPESKPATSALSTGHAGTQADAGSAGGGTGRAAGAASGLGGRSGGAAGRSGGGGRSGGMRH